MAILIETLQELDNANKVKLRLAFVPTNNDTTADTMAWSTIRLSLINLDVPSIYAKIREYISNNWPTKEIDENDSFFYERKHNDNSVVYCTYTLKETES